MEKILFINACAGAGSRTLCLARFVLDKLGGKYTEVNLQQENPQPLSTARLKEREKLIAQGNFSDEVFGFANDFAAADTIVIAAPYWDLSFPALLKIYLEQVCVCDITFEYRKGAAHGLCKANRLIYVTTAGGNIYENLGFEYVKALASTLFSIPETLFFKAEGLDLRNADVKEILTEAKAQIERTLEI